MEEEAKAKTTGSAGASDFLAGGGEMGALMRARDWSKTSLGPISEWPQTLRSGVGILLPSRAQIILFWGSDLTVMYNDAYRPVLGVKHPWALGLPGREAWSEIWDGTLHPLLKRVLQSGESFWATDHPFFIERLGFLEETYFDVSYDPMRDELGRVGGVFCIVSETTGRVIGPRRLRTLREISEVASTAGDEVAAFQAVAHVLSRNPQDVPFALFYNHRVDSSLPLCVATSGIESISADLWPLDQAAGKELLLEAPVPHPLQPLIAGPWPEPVKTVLILPILSGGQAPLGYLVAGTSPRLQLEESYRDFLRLVAANTASAVSAARALAEERARAQALAELDRAKTAFFSNVSHEFRTPLTLILGPLEDVLNTPRHSLGLEALESMHRNSLRLLRLVNTLLDFARIEEHRMQALYQPTDLPALTAELASAFRSAIEKAGLQLVVECGELAEPAYVDRDMWEKIVLNLLSNAFKFTRDGQIEVRVRQVGSEAHLSVRDTGIGIPADGVPKLFERFYRVEETRGRTHEGTGIGLALVQELVKLHGGTVSVESTSGKGSTFTVSIPLGDGHLPEDRIAPAETANRTGRLIRSFTEEAQRWNSTENLPSADASSGTGNVSGNGAGAKTARILIVDDNADMRDYISRILEDQYEIEPAEDGEKALLAINRKRPDLILSDVMMPRLDGIELLRILRADTRTDTLPVILLSARAGEEAGVEGLQAGADDYLIKPFSARELTTRVAAHLRMARVRDDAKAALHAAYDHEHRIAVTFQDALFAIPAEDAFSGVEICGEYESALDEAEVGGDFIDAFALPNNQVALVIGDVSGKGLSAAARTAEIRYTLRSFLREDSRPDKTLARLNNALCVAQVMDQEPLEGFTCLALAVFDPATGAISFSCAGAEPPFIVRSSGQTEEIDGTGTPLAVASGVLYPLIETALGPEDVVVMVTDGITESRSGKEFFGYPRLLKAGERTSHGKSLREMAKGILGEAKAFGGRLRDDACVLLARRR